MPNLPGDDRHTSVERLTTGVPGLDDILGGGLVPGGLYLVEGAPGAGKTIMAAQLAFHFARNQRKVLLVTLIAESHGKMLRHLKAFDWFDDKVVGDSVLLLSGFDAMVSHGLDGLMQFIAEALNRHPCELLVLDGFAAARDFSDGTRSLALFIHQLNTLVSTMGCTAILLAPLSGTGAHPEHTLVDGLIELQRARTGVRRAREIEVHKMRGGRHLTGQHAFEIAGNGIRIYPRLESLPLPAPPARTQPTARLTTGVPSLDRLIGGGVMSGSATALLGAPGVGKTLLGINFLAGNAAQGRRALYYGFYESPDRLITKAKAVGIDLRPLVDAGMLRIEWQPSLEFYLDQAAVNLLTLVHRNRVDAVFIDGTEGFVQGAVHPERMSRFLTALTAQLRALGVTTVLSEELPLFEAGVESKALSLSAIVENALVLRFFELRSELRRLISVVKLRDSNFDASIRAFTIGRNGIEIGDEIVGVEQVLMGSPHLVGSAVQPGVGVKE